MGLSVSAGNPYLRGRLNTVDLLVLTCLDQLILIIQILFTFYKTSYLDEEANGTEPSRSVSVPWCQHHKLDLGTVNNEPNSFQHFIVSKSVIVQAQVMSYKQYKYNRTV
jgi:hypothetical protein